MNIVSIGIVTTAIIAVTEALKKVLPDKIEGIIVIAVATALGLVAGILHLQGLTPELGVTTGLSAVGVHIVTSKIGGN